MLCSMGQSEIRPPHANSNESFILEDSSIYMSVISRQLFTNYIIRTCKEDNTNCVSWWRQHTQASEEQCSEYVCNNHSFSFHAQTATAFRTSQVPTWAFCFYEEEGWSSLRVKMGEKYPPDDLTVPLYNVLVWTAAGQYYHGNPPSKLVLRTAVLQQMWEMFWKASLLL